LWLSLKAILPLIFARNWRTCDHAMDWCKANRPATEGIYFKRCRCRKT